MRDEIAKVTRESGPQSLPGLMRCQLSSESVIVADYLFARFYEDLGRPGMLLDRQRPRRNRDAPTQENITILPRPTREVANYCAQPQRSATSSLVTAIANRLKKNWDKLKPWADKLDIEAFRLYDRDIPEYPSIIEVFGNNAVLWDRRDDQIDKNKDQNFQDTVDAIVALGIPRVNMVVKRRARQAPRGAELIMPSSENSKQNTEENDSEEAERPKGRQYTRRSRGSPELLVREGSHQFLVNLHDYLDTGLFLDHRLTRRLVADHVQKRTTARLSTRFLNLFCYTGSFSVYAARAGATVTSVDMSPVYLAWAERNFIANNLMTSNHRFINADVLTWMKEGSARKTGPYDFIFCDPPTFSNSKKMEGTWDIQRDHKWLVEQCLDALSPDGVLIFSANRRDFTLDPEFFELEDYKVRELTRDTLPKDFHDAKARRVYLFS